LGTIYEKNIETWAVLNFSFQPQAASASISATCDVFNNGSASKNAFYHSGGTMGKLGILKEFWDFLKVRKKWWLTPIILVMVLLGALIVFSQGSTVAPFIYTLF
jgi:hypothetical protein